MTIDGVGPQLSGLSYRGILTFGHLPPELQNAEDSTLAADHERGRHHFGRPFTRPATTTERRLLLEHLGYELPEDVITQVEWVAGGVRNRYWPQLEDQA